MGLINSVIKSKVTGKSGVIIDADKKQLIVSFEYGGKIGVPLNRFDDLFDCEDQVKADYDEFVSQFRKEKPVKLGTKNIAIRAAYCDGGLAENGIGFAGPCSQANMVYNIENKSGPQCKDKEGLCFRLYNKEISEEEFKEQLPCYECRMLKEWKAHAGIYKTGKMKGKPMSFKEIAPQSLCFLTTVFPGEEERYVFALFYINESDNGDFLSAGYVKADPAYRVSFSKEEAHQLNFWDHYSNANNAQSKQWSTGLHRYLDNDQAVSILKKAIEVKAGQDDEKVLKDLLNHFCEIKGIEA